MRILVAGGAGFIGSNLIKRLAEYIDNPIKNYVSKTKADTEKSEKEL